MPNFELLEDKVQNKDLKDGDHIMIKDQLWRVIRNFPVLGGGYDGNRMLMLAYHTHTEPRAYKFHPVRDETRVEVFRQIQ